MPRARPPPRPLTESDFGRLDEAEQAMVLLRRQQELDERHAELVEGQWQLGERLSGHGNAIRDNADATRLLTGRVDRVASDLSENTSLTRTVHADASAIKRDTAQIVSAFNAAKTTFTTLDWASRLLTKVAIPGGLIYGGYKAVAAWIHSWHGA